MYFSNSVYILEARSTPSTTTSRTTATPANKKTVSPMTTPTMTTTSAARITRKVPIYNVVII